MKQLFNTFVITVMYENYLNILDTLNILKILITYNVLNPLIELL